MNKEMICIVCPMSCHITVETNEQQDILKVTGNNCPRGDIYVRKELTNPTRMLTSTVVVENGIYNRLPVITSSDIPKTEIFHVMEEINKIRVEAPIKNKQVLLSNVCGLGVDIIASRSMETK